MSGHLRSYTQESVEYRVWNTDSLTVRGISDARHLRVRHRSVVIVPPAWEGGLEFSEELTKKIVSLFMSRLTNNSGLPYKIVIKS